MPRDARFFRRRWSWDDSRVAMHGSLKVDVADEYELNVETNDGARLAIDDKLDHRRLDDRARAAIAFAKLRLAKAITQFNLSISRARAACRPIQPRQRRIAMSFDSPGATSRRRSRIIPTDNFTYRGALGVQQHGSGEGLLMDVFLGTNFEQPLPEQSRVVKNIDFDWGEQARRFSRSKSQNRTRHETIAQAVEVARQVGRGHSLPRRDQPPRAAAGLRGAFRPGGSRPHRRSRRWRMR